MKKSIKMIIFIGLFCSHGLWAASSSSPKMTKLGPRTTDLLRSLLVYKDSDFQKCVEKFKSQAKDLESAKIIEEINVPDTEDGTLVTNSIMAKDEDGVAVELQIIPFEGGYDCKVVKQSKAE